MGRKGKVNLSQRLSMMKMMVNSDNSCTMVFFVKVLLVCSVVSWFGFQSSHVNFVSVYHWCTLVQCLVNIVWEIEGNTDSVLFLHLCELESARFANTELGLIWWLDELPAMTRLPPAARWRWWSWGWWWWWWWWWWWCYNDLIKMKVIMMVRGSGPTLTRLPPAAPQTLVWSVIIQKLCSKISWKWKFWNEATLIRLTLVSLCLTIRK